MKRSNRLILLIGVFLAIVAFVGILVVFRQPSTNTNGGPTAVNEPTVIAATDIALGQEITEAMLSVTDLPPTARNAGAFGATSQVVGEIARQPITKGQQVTSVHTSSGAASADIAQLIPVGFTAVAVQVDQVSGVGTLINPGDRVDMVVGFTGDKFPVISVDPSADNQITVVSGLNNTSVKVLLSGMQVLTTIRQAPTTQQQQAQAEQQQTGDQPPPTLTGESLIVVVAALPQQAEVIKFAQLDGSVSLVLRSPDDFIDPNTGEPLEFVAPAETTGITLKVLVDTYDVLVPQLVETLLPAVNNR